MDDLMVSRDANGKGIGLYSPSRRQLTRQIAHDQARRSGFVPPPPAPPLAQTTRPVDTGREAAEESDK